MFFELCTARLDFADFIFRQPVMRLGGMNHLELIMVHLHRLTRLLLLSCLSEFVALGFSGLDIELIHYSTPLGIALDRFPPGYRRDFESLSSLSTVVPRIPILRVVLRIPPSLIISTLCTMFRRDRNRFPTIGTNQLPQVH